MVNHYRLFTFGASAAIALSALCAAPGNRVFYGFSLGSAEFADETKTYDFGFVSYPFDPAASEAEFYGNILDSYYSTPSVGVFAGAGIEGIIYACEYAAAGVMTSPVPGNLVKFNTFNGTKEIIGEWSGETPSFKPQDLAWSEKDSKMYAIGYENSASGLYELDLSTAKFKLINKITNGGGTLAIHPDGTIYSISSSGTLYTINPETGKAAKVMDLKMGSMLNNQSMEFDRASGLLYWVSTTTGHPQGYENSWLQEIDVKAKTMREVGQVGIGNRLVALHIPSAENLLAPAAPSEVTSVADASGALKATLSFTVPATTLNGNSEIGTLYGYIVTRNGERMASITTADGAITPGQKIEWTDENIPSTGEYRYDIYFYNGKGNGAKGTVFQYIGPDAPGKVTDIQGVPAEDMTSLTLTWKAPESGRHLGAFDPATVTYTVTRNDNIVVAKDIKECTITDDDFLRVMRYSYTITSSNEQGSSEANSGDFIIGPAFELPFEQTFENDAQVRGLWTDVDANNDGISWMFNTTLGQAAFGDFESAAEYIVSPPLGNSDNGNADEWLLSPPMLFEKNIEYEVTISSRSYSKDDMDFYLGKNNTVAAMTEKIGTISVDHDPANPDLDPLLNTIAFRRRSVDIPVMEEDVVRCIGLHLNTTHPTHGYLQINGIYVGEKGLYNSGVTNIEAPADDIRIAVSNNLLTVFGNFRNAEIFNLNGQKIISSSSALIDLNGLSAGVYVINIDGRSFKLAI